MFRCFGTDLKAVMYNVHDTKDGTRKPVFELVELLMKSRLIIARFGEMDKSRWWNTKSLLAPVGELALERGFPKSHVFARSRAAFAVAASRSAEIFDPPDSITLWRLPTEIEDEFEQSWAEWLEEPQRWAEFICQIDQKTTGNVLADLEQFGLVSKAIAERAGRLRRADDSRSVPIKLNGESLDDAVRLLAAAYSCCEPGKLSVPYVRLEELSS